MSIAVSADNDREIIIKSHPSHRAGGVEIKVLEKGGETPNKIVARLILQSNEAEMLATAIKTYSKPR